MKKILVHSLSGMNNQMFDPHERDGYNDPYIFLRERLFDLGYELTTSDSHLLDDSDWVFFFDIPSVFPYRGIRGAAKKVRDQALGKGLIRDLYAECVLAGMQERIALFLWEAPAVFRANWNFHLHEPFPIIFTWHDSFVNGQKYHKMYWPQTRQFPIIPSIPFGEKKFLVNISMNKNSRHPRELYSARRSSIRYFERTHPNEFDLFGIGWNRPKTLLERYVPGMLQTYSSYRGTVKNKWDVLPYYRFCICYENIRDEPGWVTEKIFDAMRSGCVPIYWGAPNITDYVNAEAFIDRRKFKSDAELELYLLRITVQEYERFQVAMQDYLLSEQFAKFLPPAFADTIIRTLHL